MWAPDRGSVLSTKCSDGDRTLRFCRPKASRKTFLFQSSVGQSRYVPPSFLKCVKWTKLSCRTFRDNQTRLQLFALAYNLANFLRRLALPKPVRHWSLTTLREKLIKIGAKIVRHARYVTFQMAEVAIPRQLFQEILQKIARLGTTRPALKPG